MPAAAVVAAAAAAGCGVSGPSAARREAAAPAASRGTAVTVVRSQYGRILADGRGQALYVFSRETGRTSRCHGRCAKAWPPVPARGRPVAGGGAHAWLLGTTARRDGTRRLQLTYAGHPVYLYVGDGPGRVLCHGVTEFGGVWRVVRADGRVVR